MDSLTLFLITSPILLVFIKLVHWLFSPTFYTRPRTGPRGFGSFQYKNRETRRQANLLRELKREGDGHLPPYPDGWFRLVSSDQLEVGDVVPLKCLGKDFAVLRTRGDGKAHVLDAYCPHLGADMSIGNKVTDDGCLECPFHGWKFRASDGKCVEIPEHDKKIPDLARIFSYPTSEINGQVFVWHSHDPEKADQPSWWLEEIEELKGISRHDLKNTGPTQTLQRALERIILGGEDDKNHKKWRFAARVRDEISSHFQEIIENGCDLNHFRQYHETLFFGGCDTTSWWYRMAWFVSNHKWTDFNFEKDRENNFKASVYCTDTVYVFGKEVDKHRTSITWLGPGIQVIRPTKGCIVIQHVTPIKPGLNMVSGDMFVAPFIPYPAAAKLYILAYIAQWGRDSLIWERKTFKDRGVLISSDSTLVQFRRWAYQFYGKNMDDGDKNNNNEK